MNEINVVKRRLIPVAGWPKFHLWPSVAGLRALIFNSRQNGFEKCLRRCGRRILIDEAEFFMWLDARKENGGGK